MKQLQDLVKLYRELHNSNLSLKKDIENGSTDADELHEIMYQNELRMYHLYNDILDLRGHVSDDRKVQVNKYYRHFKGKWYYVMCIAKDCEDINREIVVYQALYGDKQIYIRSLKDFLSYIDFHKYPEYNIDDYRFTSFDELEAKVGNTEVIRLMQTEIPFNK